VVVATLVVILLILPAAVSEGGLSNETSSLPSSNLSLTSTDHPEEFSALPVNDHVELRWQVPSWVDGFYIFRTDNLIDPGTDDGWYEGIAYVIYDQGTYLDYDVEPGGRYVYFLEPFSTYLSDYRLVEFGGGTPGSPRELRAETSLHRINLTWWVPFEEGGTGVREFRILKMTDSGSYRALATVDRSTGDWASGIEATWTNYNLFEYIDMDVLPGHQYQYRITSVNDIGVGGAASIGPIAPRPSPTITLIKPLEESCDKDTIRLDWMIEATNERVESFRIYYYSSLWSWDTSNFRENYMESMMVKEVSYPANSTTIELRADYAITFRISAVYADGTEAFSEPEAQMLLWCEGAVASDPTPLIAGMVALLLIAVLALLAFGQLRKGPKR
jgi:hypothetical protein